MSIITVKRFDFSSFEELLNDGNKRRGACIQAFKDIIEVCDKDSLESNVSRLLTKINEKDISYLMSSLQEELGGHKVEHVGSKKVFRINGLNDMAIVKSYVYDDYYHSSENFKYVLVPFKEGKNTFKVEDKVVTINGIKCHYEVIATVDNYGVEINDLGQKRTKKWEVVEPDEE